MVKNRIVIDVTSDLHSLVKIDCLYRGCKHHQKDASSCNLKYIEINTSGMCVSCEERSMSNKPWKENNVWL